MRKYYFTGITVDPYYNVNSPKLHIVSFDLSINLNSFHNWNIYMIL
jgi:hypothetical protein